MVNLFLAYMHALPVGDIPDVAYDLIDEEATIVARDQYGEPALLIFKDGTRANLIIVGNEDPHWYRSNIGSPLAPVVAGAMKRKGLRVPTVARIYMGDRDDSKKG
jgi:hypothetical protein